MRWIFDIYMPLAKWGLRELRSPGARFLVSIFCIGAAGVLVWKVLLAYQQSPSSAIPALLILGVPVAGAMYLLYVVYLTLFASGRRVQKGLISPRWLRIYGYGLIPLGFWMLGQGRLDGAFAIVAGLACLGLAQQRGGWFFGD